MTNRIKYLNGLGLVASGKRNIRSGVEYNRYFSAPKREDKYLTYAGTTNDTIGFMGEIIKSTLADTKQIAPVLKGENLQRTLSNIFTFVFSHLQYKPDDPVNEELRRPKRAWADRVTGVDCDCYSIFIGSILSNLNIPFALRMVKINNKPYFQHVYVVVPKSGKRNELESRSSYFVVDPVLDTFNEEHPFTGKYDLFMQPIKYLNGVPSASLNGLRGGVVPNLYYSPEAAREKSNNVIFFDGLDYYERVNGIGGLNGLQGLNGLGFLKKVFGAVKSVGKVVKNIAKKAVKPIVYKKDGTKRGVFQLLSKKQPEAPELQPLTPIQPTVTSSTAQFNTKAPLTITPLGVQQQQANSVTPKDMVDIAQSMDKSLGVDKILSIVKSVVPDNSLIAEIIDAKSKANQGVSTLDARLMATDAAKAREAEITNNVMEQVYRMEDMKTKQAGFLNPQSLLLMGLGIGLTAVVMKMNHAKTA